MYGDNAQVDTLIQMLRQVDIQTSPRIHTSINLHMPIRIHINIGTHIIKLKFSDNGGEICGLFKIQTTIRACYIQNDIFKHKYAQTNVYT